MRWWRALFALSLVLLFAWAVWEGRNWRLQTKLTPWAIGIPVTVLAAVVVVQELWPRRRVTGGAEPKDAVREAAERALEQEMREAGDVPLTPAVGRRRTAAIVGWILGFFLAIMLLGFHSGVPLMAFLYLRFGGRESWLWTILITVGSWASVALFFDCVVHVFFEPGLLAPWYEPLLALLPFGWGDLFLPGC